MRAAVGPRGRLSSRDDSRGAMLPDGGTTGPRPASTPSDSGGSAPESQLSRTALRSNAVASARWTVIVGAFDERQREGRLAVRTDGRVVGRGDTNVRATVAVDGEARDHVWVECRPRRSGGSESSGESARARLVGGRRQVFISPPTMVDCSRYAGARR